MSKICSLRNLQNIYTIAITVAVIYLLDLNMSHKEHPVILMEKDLNQTAIPCKKEVYNPLGASMKDPKLIDYIRNHLLNPPSVKHYNLTKPQLKHFSKFGQSAHADKKYFKGMRDGFFIEVGAAEGERLSNTLYFERELGWRGLLIEANHNSYGNLTRKHRNAWSINNALALTQEASEVSFHLSGSMSHIVQKKNYNKNKVLSIPFYSILKAMDVQVVDFLSLDIESFEVKVLKTIPWDKIKFRLMCIEINHIPEGVDHLTKYLEEKGYKFLEIKGIDAWYGWPSLLNETIKH